MKIETAASIAWNLIAKEVNLGQHDQADDSYQAALLIGLRTGRDAESKQATARLLELRGKGKAR